MATRAVIINCEADEITKLENRIVLADRPMVTVIVMFRISMESGVQYIDGKVCRFEVSTAVLCRNIIDISDP